jgi:hypothetical protein
MILVPDTASRPDAFGRLAGMPSRLNQLARETDEGEGGARRNGDAQEADPRLCLVSEQIPDARSGDSLARQAWHLPRGRTVHPRGSVCIEITI